MNFRLDSHTVHDFEKRFKFEDEHFLSDDNKHFRWFMLNEPLQCKLF